MKLGKLLIPVIALLFVGGNRAWANEDWEHANVMGSEACGECHEQSVAVWEETFHYTGIAGDEDKEIAAEGIAAALGLDDFIDPEALCSACHFTVALEEDGSEEVVVLEEGAITCESCHNPASDWIDLHSNFGGNDIASKDETPAHKKKRLNASDQAGMIRPDNIYQLAKNCLSCHMVTQGALVNKTEHSSGSDFELVAWSQGEVRHNFIVSGGDENVRASKIRLRSLYLVGIAVELEIAIRSLASAQGKFAISMHNRARQALLKLNTLQAKVKHSALASVIAAASGELTAGNSALEERADLIANASLALSRIDPIEFSAIDSLIPSVYKGEPSL